MKMEFLRSRTTPKKQTKPTKHHRSSQSEPAQELQSIAQVASTDEGVEQTTYSSPTNGDSQKELDMSEIVKGVTNQLSDMSEIVKSVATQLSLSPRKLPVDVILDSDEDSDEIFVDEEDDDNDDGNGIMTSKTWDESYGSANLDETSPAGVTSAPGRSFMPKGSPSRIKPRHSAQAEYAAVAAANTALCAAPLAPILRTDSEESRSTRRRSESNSYGSDGGKKKSSSGHSSEDYTDDEDEGEDGYKPGGYHPVKLGEVYNQRYAYRQRLDFSPFCLFFSDAVLV
jgi:hypothetical protein